MKAMVANMKTVSILTVIMAALFMASCRPLPVGSLQPVQNQPAPPTPPPAPKHVGFVRAESPLVYVNNRAVAGVVQLYDGDNVRTGAGGWATITFNSGGTLRMHPNSDPLLKLISEIGCLGSQLVAYIGEGEFDFQNVKNVCVCDRINDYCAAPRSDFRIVVDRNGSRITVSQGSLLVSVGYPRPREQYSVQQGFGMTVSRGKARPPQRIVQ